MTTDETTEKTYGPRREPDPELGPALRRERVAAGLTQEQLAREVGCGVGHMRAIERGRRYASDAMLGRINAVLDALKPPEPTPQPERPAWARDPSWLGSPDDAQPTKPASTATDPDYTSPEDMAEHIHEQVAAMPAHEQRRFHQRFLSLLVKDDEGTAKVKVRKPRDSIAFADVNGCVSPAAIVNGKSVREWIELDRGLGLHTGTVLSRLPRV